VKITIEWTDGSTEGASLTIDGKVFTIQQVMGGHEIDLGEQYEDTIGGIVADELFNVIPDLIQQHARANEERGEIVTAWETLTEDELESLQ